MSERDDLETLKRNLVRMRELDRSEFEEYEAEQELSRKRVLVDLTWVAIPCGNIALLLLVAAHKGDMITGLGWLAYAVSWGLVATLTVQMFSLLWRTETRKWRWGVILQSLFLVWMMYLSL